ncbi:hypothetical protein HaLaN_31502 [Haematococcus lacustris]|uniref:Uncharacterized protein n=1 Tax=Haematococcus lacustris TaxID=44745 RepID=A0A6A0AJX8_HAELA|nr:hypothetical protein HaLaN_31502 [Haematococcus lacustris]
MASRSDAQGAAAETGGYAVDGDPNVVCATSASQCGVRLMTEVPELPAGTAPAAPLD